MVWSDDDEDSNEGCPHVRASEYRSVYFRTARENTNGLDESILGPTKVTALPWSSHLTALLAGTQDSSSPLYLLRGHESTVIKKVYELLVGTWRPHIVLTPPAHAVGRAVGDCAWDSEATEKDYEEHNHVLMGCCRFRQTSEPRDCDHVYNRLGRAESDRPEVAFSLVGNITFPTPTGRNVNMLPFIMGDKESLPTDLRPYYETVIAQCPVSQDEYGAVCYLTITEGHVSKNESQRRPGLHVEAAGGVSGVNGKLLAGTESNWGGGVRYGFITGDEGEPDKYLGGIFMASNMDDSCMVWDALVAKGEGIVDYHGGGEHLRPFIGQGTKLKANELAWLTDRTPHEALPQDSGSYRQFFRLVTSNISVWFKQHSTPNPKVSVPDYVLIVEDDKFSTPQAGTGESPAKRAKTAEGGSDE